MSNENDVTYNEKARPFTNLLEFKDAEGQPLAPIALESDEAAVPFTYVNTYNDVVEEWMRKHPMDGQVTKVQVNFETGDVVVIKALNTSEIEARRAKGYANAKTKSTKKFNLSAPNAVRNAASAAFK